MLILKLPFNGKHELQSNLVKMEKNMNFILPLELTILPEMEILDVKKELIEASVYEEKMVIASESAHDRKKQYKLRLFQSCMRS